VFLFEKFYFIFVGYVKSFDLKARKNFFGGSIAAHEICSSFSKSYRHTLKNLAKFSKYILKVFCGCAMSRFFSAFNKKIRIVQRKKGGGF
jgi:hypothetical protein